MLTRTSYEFHASLEPFSAFMTREWKAAACFGGIFVVAALAVIVALMSAYILSWSQPVKRHWMTIGFAFATQAQVAVFKVSVLQ